MDNLDHLGITALKAIAKAEGIPGYTAFRSATKDGLVAKIRAHRGSQKSPSVLPTSEMNRRAKTLPLSALSYPEIKRLYRQIAPSDEELNEIGNQQDMIARIVEFRQRARSDNDNQKEISDYVKDPKYFKDVERTVTFKSAYGSSFVNKYIDRVPNVRVLKELDLLTLQEIATNEGLPVHSNRNALIDEIVNSRQNPRSRRSPRQRSTLSNDLYNLAPELVEQVTQNLPDSDIINLYRSDPNLYLTLNDWYSTAELKDLNERLGGGSPITDKFRIRHLKLTPNEPIPAEFNNISVHTKTIGYSYFINVLLKLIYRHLRIKSVVVDGKTYPVGELNEEAREREFWPPTNPPMRADYNYDLNVRRYDISLIYKWFFENKDDKNKDYTELDVETMNDTLYKIFQNHNYFDNDLEWELSNPDGWNHDGRGSDQYFGVTVPLPFWSAAAILPHSNLDSVIEAFQNLRSHKFDDNYELYLNSKVEVNKDKIKIVLNFDHGS